MMFVDTFQSDKKCGPDLWAFGIVVLVVLAICGSERYRVSQDGKIAKEISTNDVSRVFILQDIVFLLTAESVHYRLLSELISSDSPQPQVITYVHVCASM